MFRTFLAAMLFLMPVVTSHDEIANTSSNSIFLRKFYTTTAVVPALVSDDLDRVSRVHVFQYVCSFKLTLPSVAVFSVTSLAVGWFVGGVQGVFAVISGLGAVIGTVYSANSALESPFSIESPAPERAVPEKIGGISWDVPSAEQAAEFSLMEVESVGVATALHKEGFLGIAGRIIPKMFLQGPPKTIDEFCKEFGKALESEGKSLSAARKKDFLKRARQQGQRKLEKDSWQALLVASIKDSADSISKASVENVGESIFSRVIGGLKRFYGSNEGSGRDGLVEADAIPAGKVVEVNSRRPVTPNDDAYSRLQRILGLHSRRYTLNDHLEGTNACVGVVEKKVLFATDSPSNKLPRGVRLADLSGATSVGVELHADSEDLNTLNADDGYAHTLITTIPPDLREEFESDPLDPNTPELSFSRIQTALGLNPSDIEVVVLNRSREEAKIRWLSEQGYNVTLIPDGTLMPSWLAAMGGQLTPGKHLVVWTTSGAPEAMMSLSALKALRTGGAVGGVRLYPQKLPKGDWMAEKARGLSEAELNSLIDQLDLETPAARNWLTAFDHSASDNGKFTAEEVRKYRQLHPVLWKEIVMGRKLFTAKDVKGLVDGAAAIVTQNKVFNLEGVKSFFSVGRRRLMNVSVRVVRIRETASNTYVWVQEVRSDVKGLISGQSFVADLNAKFISLLTMQTTEIVPVSPLRSAA